MSSKTTLPCAAAVAVRVETGWPRSAAATTTTAAAAVYVPTCFFSSFDFFFVCFLAPLRTAGHLFFGLILFDLIFLLFVAADHTYTLTVEGTGNVQVWSEM